MDNNLTPVNPDLQANVASTLDMFAGDETATETTASEQQPPLPEPWPISPLAAHIANNASLLFVHKVAPNWNLSDDDMILVKDSLAQIVTAWLPTSPDQQMNPYIAFIGGCAMIAAPRVLSGVPMAVPIVEDKKGDSQ